MTLFSRFVPDEASPSPSPDRENLSIGLQTSHHEHYNSQPTLERSGSNVITSPTGTVDTVIHQPLEGASNLTYDAPMRRSVGNFEPLIRPEEPMSLPPQGIAAGIASSS